MTRPDFDEQARLLFGAPSGGESRRLVRHLLTTWRDRARGAGQPGLPAAPRAPRASTAPADYSPAFSGLSSRLKEHLEEMARQRQRLPALLESLRELSPDDRRIVLRSDPAFHSWPVSERLVEESRTSLGSDLGRARDLADCAVIVAEAMEAGEGLGEALVNDLKARAWGARGEVLRRLSDLAGAAEAFAAAEALLAQGTGDALEEAGLLELRAALYRDQSRTEEARHLLDEAVVVYRQHRDLHLMGRAFIQKGRVHARANQMEAAVDWLRKGLGLIDPARDRSLDLAARHCLMLYLTESGRAREARFLLKASRPEILRHGTPWLVAGLRGLEGKIYGALGFPAEAERALIDGRQGFIDLKAELHAAVVSLDLATLYATQGRGREVRRLVGEILPIFQSRDLHREAIAALLTLQQASRLETASAQLLAEVRTHLDQVRRDPRLRFEPL